MGLTAVSSRRGPYLCMLGFTMRTSSNDGGHYWQQSRHQSKHLLLLWAGRGRRTSPAGMEPCGEGAMIRLTCHQGDRGGHLEENGDQGVGQDGLQLNDIAFLTNSYVYDSW